MCPPPHLKYLLIDNMLINGSTTGIISKNKIILFILLILIFQFAMPIITASDPDSTRSNNRSDIDRNMSTFNATRIFHDSSALSGGIDFGDCNNDGETELVVVGWSNRATLLSYNESIDDFDKILIWEDTRELMDVVIDDIDLTHQGNELLVGGYSNNLTLLNWNKNTNQWDEKNLWTSPYHIFGLAAGDIDPDNNGLEIAVVDWKSPTVTIVKNDNGTWTNDTLTVSEPMTNVEFGELDPNNPGLELIAVGSNGTVMLIVKEDDWWNVTYLWKDSVGLFNAEITDFDDNHDGNELMIVGRSKNATELYPDPANDGSWVVKNLWHAPGGLEGLAIGDFNPYYPGQDIAIGGYSNTAAMLGRDAGESDWTSIIMWNEHDPQETELNGVMVADFYPKHEGEEVAVVGYSGKVTMLVYEDPDFTLTSLNPSKEATGDYVTFSVNVDPVSDFNDEVEFSILSQPGSINDIAFSQTVIAPPDRIVITIDMATFNPNMARVPIKNHSFTVQGKSVSNPEIDHIIILTLFEVSSDIDGLGLLINPTSSSMRYDEDNDNFVIYDIYINSTSLLGKEIISNVLLNISLDPSIGIVKLTPSVIEPISSSRNAKLKITITKDTPVGNHEITILAKNENETLFGTSSVYLNVEESTSDNGDDPDFLMTILPILLILIIVIIIIIFIISKRKTKSKNEK
jgi:hypothetical protein